AISPYIELAERLGRFAAFIGPENAQAVRITYRGRIAELNTNLLRNAALAGVLSRSLAGRANLVNAMQLASQRNLAVTEAHQPRGGATDSIQVEIIAPSAATSVTGGVVMDKPRLLSIDGIPVEITLAGHLIYMRNIDVPGVIGHVGSVLGRNQINIANFSLGRQDRPVGPGQPLEAVALVEVDTPASEPILAELRSHPAVRLAVTVEPGG
ncbi:MAG: ACT domain-containing protein, partial [Bryobacteraceae bacterium]